MNKVKMTTAILTMSLTLALFSGCTGGQLTGSMSTSEPSISQSQESEMTHDELVAAAKAEGKVVVYSTSSRISKAGENFTAKYGIQVESINLKDFELIDQISTEGRTGTVSADFVICQDSGRVFGELLGPGYLYSYFPSAMADAIPEQYQNPLVFCINNKVFIFNNEKSDENPITNIWALTDSEWAGRFQFKNPFGEGVNSNFCTMVTKDEWADKIAQAYKAYYGKEIELTTPNAGYEWLQAVFENDLIQSTSDTTIAENIGAKGQSNAGIGLFAYSKTRYDAEKDLALKPIMDMEPFNGFYYPLYALMCKDAKNPNAAKLFIEYLLSEEGFAPWSADNGTYSSNKNIGVNESDYPMDVWETLLIAEEHEWCYSNRAEVEEFLTNYVY